MFDRLFAPALAFMMLFGATAMFVSGLFPAERAPATTDAATALLELYAQVPAETSATSLERVEVTVRRADALRQADEEERRLQPPRSGAAPHAAEGRGVMLNTARD